MSTTPLVVPKTQVAVRFIPAVNGHAPLYYSAADQQDAAQGKAPPPVTMASVNAGNSERLYVGGGGINGGFNTTLTSAQQTTKQYEPLHKALFAKAQADPSGSAWEQYAGGDPMVFSYCRSNLLQARAGWFEGACFVDVFDAAHRPAGIAENAAMLYAAPPHGTHYPKADDFLAAISQTASNIVLTVGAYNAIAAAQNQPAIAAIRLCAFSSGIYNPHDVSLNAVARAIFAGLTQQLQAGDAGLKEVHLPVDAPLFYAVQEDFNK